MARPQPKAAKAAPAKGKITPVSNAKTRVVSKAKGKAAKDVPLPSSPPESNDATDDAMFSALAVEDAVMEEEGGVDEEENVDEDALEEDDDVDDEDDVEGMERLVKALGDDGLDDVAQSLLASIDPDEDEDEDDEDDGEETEKPADAAEDRDESSEGEEAEDVANGMPVDDEDEDDDDDDDEEDEDIALDDVDGDVDEDVVPKQKVTIDNQVAMRRIRETIELKGMDWTETLITTYPYKMEDEVKDAGDDLDRELQFYKQAIWGVDHSRQLAAKFGMPFTRPVDYYAEMVKTDSHMERVRSRLMDERATIKKSEEKKRQRELKKFGKQVQVEKLKERDREKKEVGERLKSLKRKRKGALDGDSGGLAEEEFDIALEDALAERPSKRGRGGRPTMNREQRDSKFRLGAGAGKRSKQNTRESTDDFGGGGGGRGGGRGRGDTWLCRTVRTALFTYLHAPWLPIT
ncbi:Ebp2-domain-containing protein [Calocera viscosa TUFC12733]|uniref:Ebp2-domain-containing protein n=1 Tax=Calocera viscosa (strain TUFC12733) TaxID=1330018 RepID=A0A167MAA5_CALVF|nr:Ebp2-domain-containing protein [Calocera viscosa TUFC12733]